MLAQRNSFANRNDLAKALAGAVSLALSRQISEQGQATLAVSGGTTPALFFDQLSRQGISWDKVTVTLVDERQVDEESPRSNARLVHAALMKNAAASARFVPLYKNTAQASKLSLDVAVLGMGEDGHTASFFPGGDSLQQVLDPRGRCGLMTLKAAAAGEERLTYTLPALLSAKKLFLHIEGAKKMTVLDQALSGQDVLAMPIRAVLQSATPLHLYWCP